MGQFESCSLSVEIVEAYLEPCQTSKMVLFSKIVNGLNYFCKNVHLRFLAKVPDTPLNSVNAPHISMCPTSICD